MRKWVLLSFFTVIFANLVLAGPDESAPVVDTSVDPQMSSLKNVIKPLSVAKDEIQNLQKELEQAATEDAKRQIQERIDAERQRIREYRQNFRDIIGGAEAAEYEGVDTSQKSLQEQFSDLLQPLFGIWREATSDPRELENLKATLTTWEERKRKAEIIADRIQRISQRDDAEPMSAEFESAKKFWEGRQAEAVGQIGVLEAQIAEREKKQKPFIEAVSDAFSQFFKSRGLNLLLAIATGVLGYLLTRKIYSYFRKVSPVHRKGKTLTSRVSDIMAVFVAVLVAVVGVLVVFYIRGDWLLMTLVVVLLLGTVWAVKEQMPPYVDQIRMLLNLGSVREGERVMHQGIPWEVKSISFFTILKNPRLQGGELRMPIRNLMGMISRDADAKEPWFPTEADDWVLLSDETFGKIITQTPEQVVVLRLGGSFKTYETSEFLSQTPENLSHGFRLSGVFGVDYKHQPESTTTIPQIMQQALTAAIVSVVGHEAVNSIKVELLSAGASSLDYQILADFDGSLASRYQSLQRVIQGCCVDTCNANDWVIPFTQITLHQADAGEK